MQKRVAWIWNRKREILSIDTTRHEGGENGWSFHLFLYSTLTKQWTESLGFHVPTEKKEKKKKRNVMYRFSNSRNPTFDTWYFVIFLSRWKWREHVKHVTRDTLKHFDWLNNQKKKSTRAREKNCFDSLISKEITDARRKYNKLRSTFWINAIMTTRLKRKFLE